MDEPVKSHGFSKEMGTSFIALAIVGVTLTLLYQTFRDAVDIQGKKDVLLIAMSLLGTVTGYYFGRIPGELRAEAAEEASRKAERREAKNRATVRQTVDTALHSLKGDRVGDQRDYDGAGSVVSRLEALRDSQ